MKIKDIIHEDTESGDIATLATNLFARPIKRTQNRPYANTPKPENLKNWVGTVAVQFIVDKEGAVISTKVLATSKLTTINLTKSEQDFIEKDCKKKFKFK